MNKLVNIANTYLLTMINAAITPGIQPRSVRINTSIIDPKPLSITAKGGKTMHRRTRQIDILVLLRLNLDNYSDTGLVW